MAAVTTVTFIRHGESEDNVKCIWAGWRDSPLSEFGRKQAQALGRSLSSTHFTHCYASPLLRAHTTAQLIHDYQPYPKPLLQLNPNLREQNFGIAEGHPWTLETFPNVPLTELYQQKIFPPLFEAHEKFPEGESLQDLALRAEVAIRDCVLPHISIPSDSDNLKREENGVVVPAVHIALASHGVCIAELVSALLKLDPEAKCDGNYYELMNTAWMRVEIRVRDGHHGPIDPAHPPPLEVRVTHINQEDHLQSLENSSTFHVELDGLNEKTEAFFGASLVTLAPQKRHDDKVDEISIF
ncbi:phosphoglycerate mutase [Phlegmacium glaucopus]|nr:phosphoglycerate mutase [Phlegmacium glaucopus]